MVEFSEKASLFFTPPQTIIATPNTFSTLYLIRRDIFLRRDRKVTSTIDLLPMSAAILSGIDLLSKFANSKNYYFEPTRFKNYTQEYFPLTEEQSLGVFMLKNRFNKIYGMHSKKENNEYEITVDENLDEIIEVRTEEVKKTLKVHHIFLNVKLLDKGFEQSILNYQNELYKNTALQKSFEQAYALYGGIKLL